MLVKRGFLPEAIIEEIKRVADRLEIRFEDIKAQGMPGAALCRAPDLSRRRTT